MTAEETRKAMGPDFAAVADALRDQFGAKLSWLKTDTLEIGKRLNLEISPLERDSVTDWMRYWYGGVR